MNEIDTISVLVCIHAPTNEHVVMAKRALNSLYIQSYRDFDIVVVLDECINGTQRMLEACNTTNIPTTFVVRQKKQGLAKAKNEGLQHCAGTWIGYLDADDQWLPCKLEVQRNWMLQHPEYDFVFTEAWDLHQDGVMRPNCFEVGQYKTHEQIVARLPNENCLCHASAIIRKSCLDGGYDTRKELLGQEDWFEWIKAVKAGYKFYKVPERLYCYSMGTSVER